MIELKSGDILQADAEALVNTVNCVGIMGRGIALQFRKAFPENFRVYESVCKRGELHPGRMLVYETGRLTGPKYVINFPTKRHWKGKSRIEDIELGLKALRQEIRERGIRSVAVPPLGCGLGGLQWDDVKPRIVKALEDMPNLRVLLFEPSGAPEPERMAKAKKAPNLTAGRAVLLELMRRYLAAVMDPFISLLEVHKLMYFMQESGEVLKLKYQKGTYGPYAKNLRHVLNVLEGHFISGYGDADDKPGRPIELLPGASDAAEKFLASHTGTQKHFERVADLIDGFETPFGMELLATVHWVASREQAASAGDAVEKTYAWGDRKRVFTEKQIRLAWQTLEAKGWIG